jgi:hypothetical protein
MKRTRLCVGSAVLLIAFASPCALLAGEPVAERVKKGATNKPGTRAVIETDPSKVVKKPSPVVRSRVAAEACTPEQEAIIETARKAAAIRTQVATDHARGLHPSTGENDKREAQRLADKLIDPDVDFDQVVEITENIRDRVSSASLRTACSAASDANCAVRSAYVQDLSPPIHICPEFFKSSTPEQRIRTMIHESAHLSRIKEEGDSESYCVMFDCDTNCGGFHAADGWAHFVHCVSGQTPDRPEEVRAD